jgi:hypothetical protein
MDEEDYETEKILNTANKFDETRWTYLVIKLFCALCTYKCGNA